MGDNFKVKNRKPLNIWTIVGACLFIIICGLSLIGAIYHRSKIGMSEDFRKDAEAIVVDINNELIMLKKQISGIKDKDDLLERDIKLYIQTTHRKVPNIVADSISINISKLSKEYKISPELIVGIIKVESSFNPMAVGSKTKHGHARGLMQVMPEWVKKLGLKSQYDFHDIDIGIESGLRVFLIHLEEGKGDISSALYHYVNKDTSYVGKVYAAMGKFVAFRSTIDEDSQNVETDINNTNGDSKEEKSDK